VKPQFFYKIVVVVALFVATKSIQAEPVPERVKASPKNGFHHDYLLLLPKNLANNVPLLVASPTPHTSEDPAEFTIAAERIARNATNLIEQLALPVLVPVLPRPPVKVAEGQYINLYIPSLSRAAMLEPDEKLARMDRQVLAMIDHARNHIEKERRIKTYPKTIFTGFSAGGHFATRMAVLHPERVLAVWAGGVSGHPILPVAEHQGRRLTYPVGIADLEQISGKPFNRAAFQKIPVMMAQGAADLNTSLPSEPKPSESYTYEQAQACASHGSRPTFTDGKAPTAAHLVCMRRPILVFIANGCFWLPRLIDRVISEWDWMMASNGTIFVRSKVNSPVPWPVILVSSTCIPGRLGFSNLWLAACWTMAHSRLTRSPSREASS
jgi:dienelactone hydrolase